LRRAVAVSRDIARYRHCRGDWPGLTNVIYAAAVFSVPVFARLVRGSTLALKQSVYVQAPRSIGVRVIPLVLRTSSLSYSSHSRDSSAGVA
jgi:ABC-type dipeptide/oligopeptide/nickel transport system permease subunit